jgi:hypothetical protein
MFAVYASEANPDDPLAALAIGDLPGPGRLAKILLHLSSLS